MGATFPGESAEYRAARDRLLAQELDLRRLTETVAAARRALPAGGAVPEDYAFEEIGPAGDPTTVRLSELFAPGRDSLALYSFMFGPEMESACPSCTAFLDAFDGAAEHIGRRVNVAVVAKSPLPRIMAHARQRGWRRLRLLSSGGNSYNRDYFGEAEEGSQLPMLKCSGATVAPSATSGDPSSCSPPSSRVRTPATPTPSARCGTCSTSPPTPGHRLVPAAELSVTGSPRSRSAHRCGAAGRSLTPRCRCRSSRCCPPGPGR